MIGHCLGRIGFSCTMCMHTLLGTTNGNLPPIRWLASPAPFFKVVPKQCFCQHTSQGLSGGRRNSVEASLYAPHDLSE